MIIAFILWLIKKTVTSVINKTSKKTMLLLLILAFNYPIVFAQTKTLKYNIFHKDALIGKMVFNQNKNYDDLYLKMTSDVHVKFLFSLEVKTEEDAFFQDGELNYSHNSRIINGKEKLKNQTKAINNSYQIISNGKTKTLNNSKIEYNILLLYYLEPIGINSVYSDIFQQFLPINETNKHQFKLKLPDGNCTYYYYKNGICDKVEIQSSLYTIVMKLSEIKTL
ncbi:MAG: DUF6134 family protein [Daejeonella sp.]